MSKGTERNNGQLELGEPEQSMAVPKPDDTRGPVRCPRNRLVSKMLQDRGVLRLLSAPRGYGKTTLAHEYAARLFAGRPVAWVDASSPSFLAGLDAGRMQGLDDASSGLPALIVLDDIPWLHEERAATLSARIDEALRQGVEVVAITLPSCDCLGSLQEERVRIGASDLEVTEQECVDGQQGAKSGGRVRAVKTWRRASGMFMGRVPAVAWNDEEEEQEKVLEQFFEERLSAEVFRAASAIIVLKAGELSVLNDIGIEFGSREEDARIFARDYPFLGIDVSQGRFSVPRVSLDVLRSALRGSGAAELVREKTGESLRKMLDLLLDRGDLRRVEETLAAFCSDMQCAQWLVERGWTLVDKGRFELVDTLLERCPETVFEGSPTLQVLRSWDSGFLGDERESAHYAQKVLRGRDSDTPCEDERQQGIEALAYLALVAFSGKGASIYAKDEFSSSISPITPEGFLACTVDLCTDVELERALRPDPAGSKGSLEKMREQASESRARGLCALFTENEERLRDELLYRLAFHLLCHVDSELLKPVVFGIGCELMARTRRKGLSTCTEALAVRDLWKRGFFGTLGPAAGKRDAAVFEGAGRIIREIGAACGATWADIPWEIESRLPEVVVREQRAAGQTGDIKTLSVRLFGSFEATIGDRTIKEAEWRKKSKMLVILLVLNSGRDVSRDTLFAELWPGMSRVRALDNFYSVWSSACALLDNGPYIERQESFCRVNTRYVVSDVAEFEKLVRRLLTEHPDTDSLLDTYARIEALYRGGLVPSETDSQTVNAQRARYEAMYVDAMIAATDCSLKANDARLALWFARKAMETGRQREDLYEALARAQVAAGQRCSAIKTFFECKQYLRETLGLDPSCDMQDLYDKLITVDPSLMKLDSASFKKR